ncbi:hypothetical protein [Salirhabdus salicampi]|uniref:hypothetical protein n=1 Tax=Salirhabdus salicampi TaxID=476102 RepID=UPI0020C2F8F5|nr:hypothetical protein [Salirhabdus salicampi]MCP8615338.1 hypothetical protein [Salirhabdus salicampi]
MMKSTLMISTLFIIMLTACGGGEKSDQSLNEEQPPQQEPSGDQPEQLAMYESDQLTVFETTGWEITDEKLASNRLNVMLNGDKVKAILTVVPNEKSFDEVKQELKTGAGDVEIIQEEDNYLSFQSKRNESIKTEVYLREEHNNVYVFTFMVPVTEYEANKEKIEKLLNNISI